MDLKQRMPKTPKGLKTFQKLVDSAKILFHESSYHVTTVEAIAARAEVATGTFYLYFDSKLSIFRYLVYKFYHDIRKTIASATKEASSRYEIERLGLKAFINYVIKNPFAYTIIWQSLVVDKVLFKNYYSSFAERYRIQIEEAIKQNQIKKEVDPLTIAYALMGVSNFIGLQVIAFNDRELSDTEIDSITNKAMLLIDKGIINYK